jgi:hypothetical protein
MKGYPVVVRGRLVLEGRHDTCNDQLYLIIESLEEEECLIWIHIKDMNKLGTTDAVVIKRVNYMHDSPVNPQEAEAITGLAVPAALDRLRELVHESPYYEWD